MPESTLSAKIVKALNGLVNCHAERVWSGGVFARVGTPDITGCVNGRRFDLEVKVPGKRARKIQAKRLSEWAAAGAIVGTVTSVDEAVALVSDHS